MANSNSTTATRRKPSVTQSKTVKTVRASERNGITIDAKSNSLRDLMTEQSKNAWGYSTFYICTAPQLVEAGLPAKMLPVGDRKKKFIANGRDASIRRVGDLFELELTWDSRGPQYHDAHHPALGELARMFHIDSHYWLKHEDHLDYMFSDDERKNEVPVNKLINDRRATDYRLPPSKRFKFSKDLSNEFFSYLSHIYHEIRGAEIMPLSNSYDDKDGKVISLKKAKDKNA